MKLKFLLLALILIIPNTVNASEIYFENNNGVSLTKKEYDYLVERFSENFLKIMTNNDYDNLVSDELLSGKMNVNTSIPTIMPLSESYYKTGSKYIKITSICSSINCSITVYVKWYNEPKVKSYDVIGAYFQNSRINRRSRRTGCPTPQTTNPRRSPYPQPPREPLSASLCCARAYS